MKTNEAPEKIYLERILCTNEVYDTWKSQKTITDDIEYIRTDAFVEKACEWFRKIDYDDNIPPFETTEEFIEGFKKAMTI